MNDGTWVESLQLNLPAVPVTDIAVKDQDVVVSTQGRSFWILDDITPMRQSTRESDRAEVYLFEPAPAYRVGRGRVRAH